MCMLSRLLICLDSIVHTVSDEKYELWSAPSDAAVHWLWHLVAGFSPRKPGLDPRPVPMRFVLERVSLKLGYLRARRFSPESMVPPMSHTHISFVYHRRCVILAIESVVKLNTSVAVPGTLCKFLHRPFTSSLWSTNILVSSFTLQLCHMAFQEWGWWGCGII